jgi:hypothetical protein
MNKLFRNFAYTRVSLLLFGFSLSIGSAADGVAVKLKQIRVPEIAYDGLTLEEVTKDLHRYAKRLDPEKKGVRFVIDNKMPTPVKGAEKRPPVRDAFGNPIAAPSSLAKPGIRQALVNITLPLLDLSLEQVLDVMVRTADVPLTWRIEKAAVVFSAATPKQPQKLMAPAQSNAPIQKRLDQIVFPEVSYLGLTLDEVINDIRYLTHKAAGKGKRVNFLLVNGMDNQEEIAERRRGTSVLDAFGNPIRRQSSFISRKLNHVIIRMKQAELDLTLRQTLEEVVNSADRPIRFRVFDYGVVLEPAE